MNSSCRDPPPAHLKWNIEPYGKAVKLRDQFTIFGNGPGTTAKRDDSNSTLHNSP
jgi:hypothetical protein